MLSVDGQRSRLSLSIKALTEPPGRADADGGKRGRRDAREPQQAREEDPAMRKLKARFSSSGLGRPGLTPGRRRGRPTGKLRRSRTRIGSPVKRSVGGSGTRPPGRASGTGDHRR